jgi:hypothetical protein
MWTRIVTVVGALASAASLTGGLGGALGGCLGSSGEACRIDSDCGSGLVCSLEGQCTAYAVLKEQIAHPTAPVVSETVGGDTGGGNETTSTDTETDAGQCTPPTGSWPCAGPTAKRTVTNLVLAPSGHGMVRLADLANPIIESNFDEGKVALELWIDGTLAAGCSATFAWVRNDADIGAAPECLPAFVTTMPFDVPGLVSAIVYQAVLEPGTLVLTGLVNRDELIASMDPALRESATTLIDVDVDTDHDGTNDRTSIILTVVLAP